MKQRLKAWRCESGACPVLTCQGHGGSLRSPTVMAELCWCADLYDEWSVANDYRLVIDKHATAENVLAFNQFRILGKLMEVLLMASSGTNIFRELNKLF